MLPPPCASVGVFWTHTPKAQVWFHQWLVQEKRSIICLICYISEMNLNWKFNGDILRANEGANTDRWLIGGPRPFLFLHCWRLPSSSSSSFILEVLLSRFLWPSGPCVSLYARAQALARAAVRGGGLWCGPDGRSKSSGLMEGLTPAGFVTSL